MKHVSNYTRRIIDKTTLQGDYKIHLTTEERIYEFFRSCCEYQLKVKIVIRSISEHFEASSQNMSVCPIKSIKSCNNRRFDFSLWCRWLNELALRRHMIRWMANEKWQRFVRNMKDIGNYNTINKTSIFCDSHFRIRRKRSELTIHICMHINSTRHSNK